MDDKFPSLSYLLRLFMRNRQLLQEMGSYYMAINGFHLAILQKPTFMSLQMAMTAGVEHFLSRIALKVMDRF